MSQLLRSPKNNISLRRSLDMPSYYLHGFGSSAEIFKAAWAESGCEPAPDSVFIDGGEYDRLTGNRRWFALSNNDQQLAKSIARCAYEVEAFIARDLRERGLEPIPPINLVGHSQGGMIALELGCRARLPIYSIQCFGARLPSDPRSAPTAATPGAHIVLHSSRADTYVRRELVAATARRLRAAGFYVVDLVSDALPHAFCGDWLRRENFVECCNVGQ